ncbi:hypothetical protein [Bacillus cereus]|uniref:LPXTG-domain-containing protein cell wall anchor domain n=1 Tax=Bacillus cereus TIAC219 TaxID=718222 RepID=A0ABC9SPR2_BACCE|nr:hypothetical protein [Bacillus cereus]EJP81808.1 hypothetical protein IC1_06111 [Bacillus cereus VD022]EOQ57146.1 hypothetical protein IAY_05789 [Bacillus cereus TIAC219]
MKPFLLYLSLIVFVSAAILPINLAFAEVQSGYNSKTEVSFFGTYQDNDTDKVGDQDVANKENGSPTLPQTGDAGYSLPYVLCGVFLIMLSFLLVRGKTHNFQIRRECDVKSEKIM